MAIVEKLANFDGLTLQAILNFLDHLKTKETDEGRLRPLPIAAKVLEQSEAFMKWARRATSARERPSVPAGVIPPLLPTTLVDRVPQGPNWLHEIK